MFISLILLKTVYAPVHERLKFLDSNNWGEKIG